MPQIDMQRLRDTLPKRAVVKLKWHHTAENRSLVIECVVKDPALEDEDMIEQVKEWQREIIGAENIAEFYTHETGCHWSIYLKRIAFEFINVTNEDIQNYTGYPVEQLTKKE